MLKRLIAFLLVIFFLQIISYSQVDDNLESQIRKLANKYNIKIYYGKFQPSYYAKKYATFNYLTGNDYNTLSKYFAYLRDEWNKYPKGYIKKTKLHGIALVKNLVVTKDERAAMPDHGENNVYLDIYYLKYGEEYVKGTMHHEFFHLIDYELRGHENYNNRKDPEWEKLNAPGAKYGSGGAYMNKNQRDYVHKEHPKPGFINGYSTSEIVEDKAEVYSFLMVAKKYKTAEKYIKKDYYLRAKFEYMKEWLRSLDSSFTEEYFERIHKSKTFDFEDNDTENSDDEINENTTKEDDQNKSNRKSLLK